ncbi:hypothetical protein POTOM_047773 [Populus tomentosa]|uniref:Uncharacterized protein n=1 Tax=Populus tomentosa TaxID=118781 RepID=A0A8X7YE61_POPTO|nr:hypothetical protein POTOM_047773 [Populus tomentosa]
MQPVKLGRGCKSQPRRWLWHSASSMVLISYLFGRAIYAFQKPPYSVFLMSSTLAFTALLLVIPSLTYEFPFHYGIWVATASMMVTYASAIVAVTHQETVHFHYLLITASVAFISRFLIQMLKKCHKSSNL